MDFKEMQTIVPNHLSGSLATVDGDGNPDVRGWDLWCIENDKLYFCTSKNKNVYRQMQANPNIAFFCMSKGYTFRIYGKAQFVTDAQLNSHLHQKATEAVKQLYPTPESNGFITFFIEHGKVAFRKGFVPFEFFEF